MTARVRANDDSNEGAAAGAAKGNVRALPWPRRILYTVAIWAVVVGVLEIGLRLTGLGPPRAVELAPQYSKFLPDPELIWVLKPNWNGFEFNDVPVHHNSLGLRGPEPAPPGPDGPLRVLFVGDSVTYGHNLPAAATIPRRLQEHLQARTRRPIEVINAGVPGYSTFQEAIQIRRHGETLAPGLILLGFCLNDVTERYTSLAAFGGPRYFMLDVDTAAGLSWVQRIWLASATRESVVRLVRSAARRGEAYRLRALWEEPDSPEIVEAWRTVLDEIDSAAQEAAGLDVPLAVVIYPPARQVEMESGADDPQRRLAAHLERRAIPYLDLLGPLRRSRYRMQQMFLDVTHFSAKGTEVVSREVADFIVGTGLVASRSPAADPGS